MQQEELLNSCYTCTGLNNTHSNDVRQGRGQAVTRTCLSELQDHPGMREQIQSPHI